jgi:hypothetical protein
MASGAWGGDRSGAALYHPESLTKYGSARVGGKLVEPIAEYPGQDVATLLAWLCARRIIVGAYFLHWTGDGAGGCHGDLGGYFSFGFAVRSGGAWADPEEWSEPSAEDAAMAFLGNDWVGWTRAHSSGEEWIENIRLWSLHNVRLSWSFAGEGARAIEAWLLESTHLHGSLSHSQFCDYCAY